MPKYQINYSHNNSGGDWWLSDEDWYALEEDGWEVNWEKDSPSKYRTGERWLGALATSASLTIEAEDIYQAEDEAIRSFEIATNEDVEAEGCPCCGPPHYIGMPEEVTEVD